MSDVSRCWPSRISSSRARRARRQVDALDRTHLEARLSAGLEQHHGADRERPCDADQQRPDVLVIPDPAALEVGQLELSFDDSSRSVLSWVFVESNVDMNIPVQGCGN